MSPRALTEDEKCRQCEKLVDVGKGLVMRYGLSKTSVDDVVGGAGMAKGSFYKHFDTKEQFLSRVVWEIYEGYLAQAEQFIQNADKGGLPKSVKSFVVQLFTMPETAFFFGAEHELSELFEKLPQGEMQSYTQMEKLAFTKLVQLMGADTAKVNPDVVHNFLHTLYIMNGSNMMIKEALQESFDLMLNALIQYIFGGKDE